MAFTGEVLFGTGSDPAVSGSLGADVVSNPMYVGGKNGSSHQFSWSGGGSPVGQFNVQWSNDYDAAGSPGNGTWTNFASSVAELAKLAVSGNAGNCGAQIWHTCQWVREIYTRGSGTATGKGVATAGLPPV